MTFLGSLKAALIALTLGAAVTATSFPARAGDLGIEGVVYEPFEKDFRMVLLELLARHDWSENIDDLKDSAKNYTKNLPSYMLPRADQTRTKWKDVGIQVTEDIYLPHVDWQEGSVFEPGRQLVAQAGTYLNPIAQMPSAAIERLFIFDATDPDQLLMARALMTRDIPQLSFMLVAGDLGPLSEEMNRPIYHPAPTMLDKFHVTAVPSLIGFGKGIHQGHMAVTEIALPASLDIIKQAWFGLPYDGYDPDNTIDVELAPETEALNGSAQITE